MKRVLAPLLGLFLLFGLCPVPSHADMVSAKGAILIEATTGRVLYEANADERLPMASTTKIMTALLALETYEPDAIVTVPKDAVGIEGSSLYLERNERIRMIDLVYGLMLVSGNDAAVAIALTLCGSLEQFASCMNERAAELGLTDTHFVTPNGLHDDDHYTTARDLAVLTAYALKNPTFCEIVSTQYHQTDCGSRQRTFKNKNRLLWEYEGANGVKTGYTTVAGKCLSFSASRDGMQLVGVVLDCPAMWDAAKTLLNYGFSEFEMVCPADPRAALLLPVENGEKSFLSVAPKQSILVPLRKDGSESVTVSVSLPTMVQAPVAKALPVGTVTVLLEQEPIFSVPLFTQERVAERTFLTYLRSMVSGYCYASDAAEGQWFDCKNTWRTAR